MIDGRTADQAGYTVSQRIRKRVEEVFGWLKTVGNFRKTRYVGLGANQTAAYMLAAAFDLLRVAKPVEQPARGRSSGRPRRRAASARGAEDRRDRDPLDGRPESDSPKRSSAFPSAEARFSAAC
jgi:hypothetical protein